MLTNHTRCLFPVSLQHSREQWSLQQRVLDQWDIHMAEKQTQPPALPHTGGGQVQMDGGSGGEGS